MVCTKQLIQVPFLMTKLNWLWENYLQNNLQLTQLQLYIKNIVRCIGIVYLLYKRRKDHQKKLSSSVIQLLQVNYLQIKRIFNNTLVSIHNLQAHKMYSLLCLSLPIHTLDSIRTFPPLLNPPPFLPCFHLL